MKPMATRSTLGSSTGATARRSTRSRPMGATQRPVDGETSDTHVYANPTSAAGADYTVTATAVDNGGSWPAASVPVTVNQAVTQVPASGDATVAAGDTYTLTLG